LVALKEPKKNFCTSATNPGQHGAVVGDTNSAATSYKFFSFQLDSLDGSGFEPKPSKNVATRRVLFG
jgi:hypothetical protein